MLRIVTGRVGQTLQIGDDIEVTVKTVIGGQVWVEVTGPGDVQVRRKEVYERIKNDEASLLF